jgi:threonine synthase
MKDYKFADLAYTIMCKYIPESEIPRADLKKLVDKTYTTFRDPLVTPTIKTGPCYTLELFHGPTFAFKDVALQFLGNLFEYFISKKSGKDARLTIMGATSGDTGSAAIYGLRGKKGVDCFILYPKGRVSKIQEQQMTTVQDSNIHCLRVEGTFDDCQDIVKGAFMDKEFKETVKLGAVNSINWARVLAQITYYFHSYYSVQKQKGGWGAKGKVNFSVPTGNFGDILAGYYAKKMGLPVGTLVVGTNENDILARFFDGGEYEKFKIATSISPSMDICVSSNFERYLFHLFGDDPATLKALMEAFEGKGSKVNTRVGTGEAGKLKVTDAILAKARQDFLAARANTKEVLDCIKEYDAKHNYLYCPHSACGVVAAEKLGMLNDSMVCLATAHVGKFYEGAVSRTMENLPPLPDALAACQSLPMRTTDIQNSLPAAQAIALQRAGFPFSEVLKYNIRSGKTGNNLMVFFLLLVAGALFADFMGMASVPGIDAVAPFLPWKN